jgi:hypothetical protein
VRGGAVTGLQVFVRVAGLVMVALGVLFWTGNALALVPVHMLIGLLVVLALWALAVLAGAAGVNPALVALAFAWGLLVPVLGVTQERLLPGAGHWVIQVLHLVVGLLAIAQAENLARRTRRRREVARQAA